MEHQILSDSEMSILNITRLNQNQINADLNSILVANSQGADNLMVGDQPPEERLNSKDDKNGM